MSDCIMVGCDLHMKTLVLKCAVGQGVVRARTLGDDPAPRREMIDWYAPNRRRKRCEHRTYLLTPGLPQNASAMNYSG